MAKRATDLELGQPFGEDDELAAAEALLGVDPSPVNKPGFVAPTLTQPLLSRSSAASRSLSSAPPVITAQVEEEEEGQEEGQESHERKTSRRQPSSTAGYGSFGDESSALPATSRSSGQLQEQSPSPIPALSSAGRSSPRGSRPSTPAQAFQPAPTSIYSQRAHLARVRTSGGNSSLLHAALGVLTAGEGYVCPDVEEKRNALAELIRDAKINSDLRTNVESCIRNIISAPEEPVAVVSEGMTQWRREYRQHIQSGGSPEDFKPLTKEIYFDYVTYVQDSDNPLFVDDLGWLAIASDQTIIFYAGFHDSEPTTFNPGKPTQVAVEWDGMSNFIRLANPAHTLQTVLDGLHGAEEKHNEVVEQKEAKSKQEAGSCWTRTKKFIANFFLVAAAITIGVLIWYYNKEKQNADRYDATANAFIPTDNYDGNFLVVSADLLDLYNQVNKVWPAANLLRMLLIAFGSTLSLFFCTMRIKWTIEDRSTKLELAGQQVEARLAQTQRILPAMEALLSQHQEALLAQYIRMQQMSQEIHELQLLAGAGSQQEGTQVSGSETGSEKKDTGIDGRRRGFGAAVNMGALFAQSSLTPASSSSRGPRGPRPDSEQKKMDTLFGDRVTSVKRRPPQRQKPQEQTQPSAPWESRMNLRAPSAALISGSSSLSAGSGSSTQPSAANSFGAFLSSHSGSRSSSSSSLSSSSSNSSSAGSSHTFRTKRPKG